MRASGSSTNQKCPEPTGRHPNTNTATMITTSVAKMTAWMMSPLVMRAALRQMKETPVEVLNRGLSRPQRSIPWANSFRTVSGSHGKIGLRATVKSRRYKKGPRWGLLYRGPRQRI